jgi:aspartate aminotransferase, cytoplasmic
VNHLAILRNVAIKPVPCPYYSFETHTLAFTPMLKALVDTPSRSVFLFQSCTHNPTGVDPTDAQWREIASVLRRKAHFAFFDCAYPGFGSGDPEQDVFAVREFVRQGVNMLVCQSFSKSAGLYGERVGALHLVAPDEETAGRMRSQLSVLQRSEISNPPCHGARIVRSLV